MRLTKQFNKNENVSLTVAIEALMTELSHLDALLNDPSKINMYFVLQRRRSALLALLQNLRNQQQLGFTNVSHKKTKKDDFILLAALIYYHRAQMASRRYRQAMIRKEEAKRLAKKLSPSMTLAA